MAAFSTRCYRAETQTCSPAVSSVKTPTESLDTLECVNHSRKKETIESLTSQCVCVCVYNHKYLVLMDVELLHCVTAASDSNKLSCLTDSFPVCFHLEIQYFPIVCVRVSKLNTDTERDEARNTSC